MLMQEVENLTRLPLEGKTIVVTRGEEQAVESNLLLQSLGAKVILFPTIGFSIKPIDEDIKEQICNGSFDYLFFPSQNAVTYLMQNFKRAIALHTVATIVAVGKKTVEKLHEYHITTDIVPAEYNAAGVLAVFKDLPVAEKKGLIVCSDISRPELEEGLIALGMQISRAEVFSNGLPRLFVQYESNKALRAVKPDVYMFTSPSTFLNFLIIADVKNAAYFSESIVIGIGPTTEKELRKFGVEQVLRPKEATFASMVETIAEFYINDKREQENNE